MRALLRALRPTVLIPMLLAFLASPPVAFAGGPYYDSNGNNVYAAPTIVYGPTQGYASGTVPHVICDSGCSGGGSASSVAINDGTTTSQKAAVDGSGNLSTKIGAALPAGSNVIGHVIADTGSTTAVTGTVAANQTQVNGVAVSVGNGTTDTGTQRVTLSSDGTGQVKLAAGTQNVGSVNIAVSATSFGGTKFHLVAANSTNATNVKTTAGQVYHISAFGVSTTQSAWVKFYDKATTAPTCNTDTVVWSVFIPAPSAGGAGAIDDIPAGLPFTSGIGICITTGIADNDNTAVAASSYVVNISYK